MSNNQKNAFSQKDPNAPKPTVDPLAEAKKKESASLDALAVKPEVKAPDAGVTVNAPAPEPEAAQATVTETTGGVQVEQPVVAVARIAPRAPDNTMVKRGDGAAARESSPSTKASVQNLTPGAAFQSLISNERNAGTVSAQNLISFLDAYVVQMAPGRATGAETVLKFQEGLHDSIVHVIERAPSTEFKRLWNILIAYFVEYKTQCFAPRYYGRGAKDWKRNPEQFTTLTSLINLLYVSSSDMKTVNQNVNINSVMGQGFSEEGRGRVISFYVK